MSGAIVGVSEGVGAERGARVDVTKKGNARPFRAHAPSVLATTKFQTPKVK